MTKLEKIFHEPNRLAILTALCGAPHGVVFPQLKEECGLTDGNLNRHLKVLQENEAVTIKKAFVANKPCTTVFLSAKGRQSFVAYLSALEEVLQAAAAKMKEGKRGKSAIGRLNILPT